MLRKYWRVTPTTAAHMNTSPRFEAMKGQRMYSPEPTPRPARITLGPSSLPSGNGSGMSRYGMAGTLRLGAISANSSVGLPAGSERGEGGVGEGGRIRWGPGSLKKKKIQHAICASN